MRLFTVGSATPVRRVSQPIRTGVRDYNPPGPKRGIEDKAVQQLVKMADSLTFDYGAFALAMGRVPHKIQVRVFQMVWAWFEYLALKADANLFTGDEEFDNMMKDCQSLNRLANP